MMLNTRIKIKGEPMVDTVEDEKSWTEKYGVKVVTGEDTDIGI